jgi:cell division protein ZapA (FtsZ GTPase activity inhibitor)
VEKHSININIFGRQFPAKVDSEEAAVIEEAAKTINAKIKAFKAEYKIQDDLDISIMCCLDIMTEYLTYKAKQERLEESFLNELSVLEQKLDYTIQVSEEK